MKKDLGHIARRLIHDELKAAVDVFQERLLEKLPHDRQRRLRRYLCRQNITSGPCLDSLLPTATC